MREPSIKVKFLAADAKLPHRATPASAGYDIFASAFLTVPGASAHEGKVSIGRSLIPTGLAIEIPTGFVGRIGSRSGLSTQKNIEVGAGWIDSDYRGEIKVELKNFGPDDFSIQPGMKIAQLIILPLGNVDVDMELVDELGDTTRGSGGFGSTGL